MTKREPNGNDILRKLASLDIRIPRDSPHYMNEYKKRRRRIEKRDDPLIKQLEDEAERFWKKMETIFDFHRTGPRR